MTMAMNKQLVQYYLLERQSICFCNLNEMNLFVLNELAMYKWSIAIHFPISLDSLSLALILYCVLLYGIKIQFCTPYIRLCLLQNSLGYWKFLWIPTCFYISFPISFGNFLLWFGLELY